MLGLGWIAAYVAAAAGALLVAARRPGPTLITGAFVLRVTALFALAAAASALATARGLRPALVALLCVALAAAWAVRGRWLILRTDAPHFSAVLERCLGMLCATYERDPSDPDEVVIYTVPLAGGALRLGIRSVPRGVVVTFRGAAGHRKAALIQSLVAKQFDGVLPRVKLGTRHEGRGRRP